MSVHEKIRLVRQTKGFTQESVAEQLGMSPNAYGDIERGGSDPKLSKLQKISDILGVSLSELLDSNEKTILNVNFNKQGKHYNVYMSSDSEVEKLKLMIDKLESIVQSQQSEINYLKEIIELMKNKS
jgi:transcriptional regulator with XRE-family HTH domain